MYLSKKRTCTECENIMICSLRKSIQTTIDEGHRLGVFACYEGETPILGYQIMYAVASACKLFKQREYEEDEK